MKSGKRPSPDAASLKVGHAQAEALVAAYFAERKAEPSKGILEISGQRYLKIRAASLAIKFFAMIRGLFAPERLDEADHLARNMLFDFAHALGKSDAGNLSERLGISDPIVRGFAGQASFAHCGWGLVDIKPESRPAPNSDFYLLYDHVCSFEADAWIQSGRPVDFPACIMNAGYSSGWTESGWGVPITACEVLCRAKGDPCCRFIMAPPHRIKEHVQRYLRKMNRNPRGGSSVKISHVFLRHEAGDLLREAYRKLEGGADARTSELEAVVQRLQDEVTQSRHEAERLSFLSRAMEQSNEGVCVLNLANRIQFVNSTFAQMHGYEPEEVLNKPVTIYHSPAQLLQVRAGLAHTFKEGAFTGEIWHTRRDGSTFPTMMSVCSMRNDKGQIIGTIAIARDISAQKQAESALRKLEGQFRDLLANVQLAAVMLDTKGRVVFCNEFLLKLTGWQADEVIGHDWFERFVPADVVDRVQKMFARYTQHGDLAPHFENDIVTRSNERRYNQKLWIAA